MEDIKEDKSDMMDDIKEKNKINCEYYLSSEDILKKYEIDAEAIEDVKESFEMVEDMLLYFTLTTLSN